MATYLDRILDHHRREAQNDARELEVLKLAASATGSVRDFAGVLQAPTTVSIIAEIKRVSPVKGELAPEIDPAQLAQAYESGGASCISVLTDEAHFGARPTDIEEVRNVSKLPILAKDFVVSANQVCDARLSGADAVLLIVAALSDAELATFYTVAKELGLSALVEVHSEADIERAMKLSPELIGINQRDLNTFEVDTQRAVKMVELLPAGIIKVAESGIESPDDVKLLREAGYHAALVGERLVRSSDPAGTLRSLCEAGGA